MGSGRSKSSVIARIGLEHPDCEASRCRQAFCMRKPAFQVLCDEYCAGLAKQDTCMRDAIPIGKRLAIFLDWAGSGAPYQSLARTYDVSSAAHHS